MKSRFFVTALLLSLCFYQNQATAQLKKLKNVNNQFVMEESPDINLAKYDIDLVTRNPETSNMAATWGWRGVVYTSIATDPKLSYLDTGNIAAKTAGEAFIKFYSYPAEEQDRLDALTFANEYLPSCLVACYNMGVSAVGVKGRFEDVKMYMEMVEVLIPHDKEQKALAANVSREKALYAIWRAAYSDSLVDSEIVYLEKLMNIPTYFNADIYLRLSEIYAARKEYDKAISYLDKGKEKIPQKSNEFLNYQINIEIDRNNSSALITKFTEAIEANPDNNAVYHYSRGVVYHNLKSDEVKTQEKASKAGQKPAPSKYFFSQGLSDYRKAIEQDPGYFDARYNEAVILNDSAAYLYAVRSKMTGAEYDKYTLAVNELYAVVLGKLEWVRETGLKKDNELLELLRLMRSLSAKIGDDERRIKYDTLYKEEKKKLESSQ